VLGDSGGELLLSCPLALIKCCYSCVLLLMHDLESLCNIGAISPLSLNEPLPPAGYDAWIAVASLGREESYQGICIPASVWINPSVTRVSPNVERSVLDLLNGAGAVERLCV
jgi:hypothetical protein